MGVQPTWRGEILVEFIDGKEGTIPPQRSVAVLFEVGAGQADLFVVVQDVEDAFGAAGIAHVAIRSGGKILPAFHAFHADDSHIAPWFT